MSWFGSSSSKPDPVPAPAAIEAPGIMDSDSSRVKEAIIKQIRMETNTDNARTLIEKINENCFEKCVPKPGGSLSSGEQTCVTQCMEKYMAAWNKVETAYLARVQQHVR